MRKVEASDGEINWWVAEKVRGGNLDSLFVLDNPGFVVKGNDSALFVPNLSIWLRISSK